MYSDVVFGWVAWIWLSISNFLWSILKFFTISFKICWGCWPLPGPRGGAEASVRREAPNGGRSGAPRARRCAQTWFSILPSYHENKVQLLSKEVQATQQNLRYSAKNNVAIHMIATFMSKSFASLTSLFLSYQFNLKRPMSRFGSIISKNSQNTKKSQ